MQFWKVGIQNCFLTIDKGCEMQFTLDFIRKSGVYNNKVWSKAVDTFVNHILSLCNDYDTWLIIIGIYTYSDGVQHQYSHSICSYTTKNQRLCVSHEETNLNISIPQRSSDINWENADSSGLVFACLITSFYLVNLKRVCHEQEKIWNCKVSRQDKIQTTGDLTLINTAYRNDTIR